MGKVGGKVGKEGKEGKRLETTRKLEERIAKLQLPPVALMSTGKSADMLTD